MKKNLQYCWKIFSLSWEANRYYALLSIIGKIYESTLYPFIVVLALSKLLDLLSITQSITTTEMLSIMTVFILATFIKMVFSSFLDTQDALIQIRMANYIDLLVDKKLTQLDPAIFESSEFQDLLMQMEGVKDTLQANFYRIIALIDSIVKLTTAIIIVISAFPLFVPIILLATVPSFFSLTRFRRKVWKFFVEENAQLIRVSRYIRNLLSQDTTSKEVAIYKTGDVLYNKVKNYQKKYNIKFTKASQSGMPLIIVSRSIQILAFLFTQALNLKAVLAGVLSIGQFTLYFQQTQNLLLGAEGVLDNYSSITIRNKYIEKYFKFMNIKKSIVSPMEPDAIPSFPDPPIIEFKNVSFKYPHATRYVLKNFSLQIKSGEKLAVVGDNGAGKTTIIKLLLRFYDVTYGEIRINGIDIKKVNLDIWHAQIGALFQEFIKYQFTYKENIIFGNQDATSNIELLKFAIEQSGAGEYLDKLPKKYDQTVGKMFKDGIDLSGGQWQKLALARAFFKNAPFLILDEPTSSIDAKAEHEIFQRVQQLQKDKTVIIISHRFSTVRGADRIIVLHNGKIIEEGNHSVLMKRKGLYEELFTIQAQGYK